jgi:hypothetical protein
MMHSLAALESKVYRVRCFEQNVLNTCLKHQKLENLHCLKLHFKGERKEGAQTKTDRQLERQGGTETVDGWNKREDRSEEREREK